MTNRSRSLILATTALATALTLAACSSSTGDQAGGEGGGEQGGTLTFALANDPLVFNPSATGNGNDTWNVTRQIYDSLVHLNADTGELEPWLATGWEINPNATEFTFTLRDDVTFSDGSALTADTVVANFEDIKAAGAASSSVADLRDYAGAEAVDEHTVVIRFSQPNAVFLTSAAGVPLAIVSEKSLEIPYAERASGDNVAGSGPFTLAGYTKDSQVSLKRREGYSWAPPSFENTGDAHFDTIEFKIVPESGNRTGGLSSGQIDVAGGISPNDIDSVEASDSIVSRANPGTVFGIYFNYKQPEIQDEKVRQAVGLAVDATEIRDGALNDKFNVATSPLSSTTKDYADVSADIAKHDPDAARRLLDEAGWVEGPDGVRTRDGQRLEFRITYINNFGPNPDSIALLQEQLRAVGIGSTQISGTVPEFQSNLASGEYEVAWRNLSRVDGDVLRADFTDVGSASNWPIPDPDLEAKLNAQVAIGDQSERTRALEEIQREIVSKSYFIPVHELTTVFGVSDDIEGIALGADSRLDLLVDAQKTS
ncbi:ABC transporter substrate-binding protein [Corynebacterium pacaense]|uniref:ABC transporter substrate-binding protein n=1 Tax=Corynebacterium pacaense TaxID=1816684 RepID=UPI0009BA59E1|nr:ABC transporter substrate-binding protein [Corynebacterium pacaense]